MSSDSPSAGPTAPLALTGATRVAAVIGRPVRHSLSPAILNAAFTATGFDAVYAAFEVAPEAAGSAVDAMRGLGLIGLNATMPHKQGVVAACDRLTADAGALGVANCLFWSGSEIVGDSTDGVGWLRGFREAFGTDVAGMRVGIVGAGGAARSVIRSLTQAGVDQIVVVNRSADRAAAAVTLAAGRGVVGIPADLGAVDLVINSTPIGMGGTGYQAGLPFDPTDLGDDTIVSDMVYHPAQTSLLAAVADRGLRHQNGLAMLIHQAAVGFEHWTGLDAPVEAMWHGAEAELARR